MNIIDFSKKHFIKVIYKETKTEEICKQMKTDKICEGMETEIAITTSIHHRSNNVFVDSISTSVSSDQIYKLIKESINGWTCEKIIDDIVRNQLDRMVRLGVLPKEFYPLDKTKYPDLKFLTKEEQSQ